MLHLIGIHYCFMRIIETKNQAWHCPQLVFLHGNVAIGYCEAEKIYGYHGSHCSSCKGPLKQMPLLYPIKQKDYAKDLIIKDQWNLLKNELANAFMVTVFGYSAPKTDMEAKRAMQEAYKINENNDFNQMTFISTQNEEDVYDSWKSFIYSHHYDVDSDFYDSFLAHHPRRTGEAYWAQNMMAEFPMNNPIPRNINFPRLWSWFAKFKKAENAYKSNKS